jgi:starch-binding outer membrane protein, SusD/RagB family
MKNSVNFLLILIAVCFTASCSKEFLDNPPEDRVPLDKFFTSDAQILGAGSGLYGRPWFFFNEKFIYGFGETYSGNSIGDYLDLGQFENMTVNSTNAFVFEGWQSLFNVIAQSNSVINILEKTSASEAITQEVIDRVKGEAYFMRATAYFYLVRTFGAVPILNKFEQYNNPKPDYPRNRVEDVYKFIINDYKLAYEKLPKITGSSTVEKGRLIKSACDGMLSKVYITLKDYSNAKLHAEKVLNSGDYFLIDDYGKLFNNPTYNNSKESIFSLQWIGCKDYGLGNSAQAYITPTSLITGDEGGYGSFRPTIDLEKAYEPGDKRRKLTIMLPGDFYPELVTSKGGFVVGPGGVGGLGFRKYVIGSKVEFPDACHQRTGQNTCMLRYAEVLLIHAESILAGAATTSSVAALSSFNEVRTRAGLPSKASITQNDIFKERRIELVLEGDYWFDLGRRDRTEAINIIKNQERGSYYNMQLGLFNSKMIKNPPTNFLLPIPESELARSPRLREDPVPFQF